MISIPTTTTTTKIKNENQQGKGNVQRMQTPIIPKQDTQKAPNQNRDWT
jgi:hypothetical protein